MAELFAWEPGRALKLYRADVPAAWVLAEAERTRLAAEAGLPAPRVYGTLEHDGRTGIVLEWIDGENLSQTWASRPWTTVALAHRLAALHAALHAVAIPALPAQRSGQVGRIERAPELAAEERARALAVLAGLPDGDRVCHNDLHPENVLLGPRGPVIIDWMDANRGNPLADVGRTLLILRGWPYTTPNPAERLIRRGVIALCTRAYLARYLALRGLSAAPARAELAAWQIPLAAIRLNEVEAGEAGYLHAVIRRAPM